MGNGAAGIELVPIWDAGVFKVRTVAARPLHQPQVLFIKQCLIITDVAHLL